MRDAPARQLLEALWSYGASVGAYDPKAAEEAKRTLPQFARPMAIATTAVWEGDPRKVNIYTGKTRICNNMNLCICS